MSAMEQALEARKVFEAIAFVADDFQGQHGAMSRRDLLALMHVYQRRYQQLNVQRLPLGFTHDGGNFATVTFQLLVSGGQGLLPESGRLLEVETTWILEGRTWLLWRANWNT